MLNIFFHSLLKTAWSIPTEVLPVLHEGEYIHKWWTLAFICAVVFLCGRGWHKWSWNCIFVWTLSSVQGAFRYNLISPVLKSLIICKFLQGVFCLCLCLPPSLGIYVCWSFANLLCQCPPGQDAPALENFRHLCEKKFSAWKAKI